MKDSVQSTIREILDNIQELEIHDSLKYIVDKFPGGTIFSSSFSMEDQIISHVILRNKLPIEIFTIDTGRLFPETYSVWRHTNEQYQTNIKAYFPSHTLLETYLSQNGPNAFYDSIEQRKQCCYLRKVEPLKRALYGKSLWVTGLRAAHSSARGDLPKVEWDEGNQIIKVHPLLNWTDDAVKSFIQKHSVPYNELHDKGFVSIGCAPCTRSIKEGEDFRAGRWWWENNNSKECGLHYKVQNKD